MLSFQKCGQSMWNWLMAKSMAVTLWWVQQASSHAPKCSFRTIRWVRQHLQCLGRLHDFGLVEKHKQLNVFFRFCVWWRWQSRPSSQFFPLQLSAAVSSCQQLYVTGWSFKPFVLTIDVFYPVPASSFVSFQVSFNNVYFKTDCHYKCLLIIFSKITIFALLLFIEPLHVVCPRNVLNFHEEPNLCCCLFIVQTSLDYEGSGTFF